MERKGVTVINLSRRSLFKGLLGLPLLALVGKEKAGPQAQPLESVHSVEATWWPPDSTGFTSLPTLISEFRLFSEWDRGWIGIDT